MNAIMPLVRSAQRRGRRALALTAFAALAAAPAAAQSRTGSAAAEFLSIPVGARASAMGGAFGATATDGTALYWNPAGLASLGAPTLTAEYAPWLVGLDFSFVSFSMPTGLGTFSGGVTALLIPEMEVTTSRDNETQLGTGETFDAGSYAIALGYGRALTDRFSIGGSVKVVREQIADYGATGVAFDVGTLFTTPFNGLRLGASILNYGTKMKMDGPLYTVDVLPNQAGNNNSIRTVGETDAFDLPLTMRVGLATEVYQTADTRVTLAVDALTPSAADQHVNLGAEVGLLGGLVAFRGGYQELFLEDSPRSFTLGGGLNYTFNDVAFRADVAYEAWDYFDDVTRFTIAFGF